jgi:phosphatidylglycerophosphatase A
MEVSNKIKIPPWARAAGTFLGTGYLQPGPGTWGSMAAVAIWSVMAWALPPDRLWLATASAATLALAAGIPAATRIGAASGDSDPSYVVIDEVAGQLVTLLWAAPGWKSALAGLILFRAFDIVKPLPLRRLEQLPGGFGVMLDDVGAGLYALGTLQLLRFSGVLA